MIEGIDQDTGEVIDAEPKLKEWYVAVEAATEAKKIIEREQTLRKEVVALLFPGPKEGVNKKDIGGGYELKYTHKVERKIDEAALDGVKEIMRKDGINPDVLIRNKPELETSAYKSLLETNPEAAKVFDQALVIKPGSPTLEIVAPKPKK